MKTVPDGQTLSFRERELTLFRRDRAEQVCLDLDYSPVLDEQNRSAGVIAIVVEVTEKICAQRRLHAERQQFGETFDQPPGIMSMEYGPDHRAEFANPAHDRLMGMRDITDRPLSGALPEIAGQGYRELLDNAHSTGETH